jgi:peroxiredoxin/mono/diheme cytochrome c family protein
MTKRLLTLMPLLGTLLLSGHAVRSADPSPASATAKSYAFTLSDPRDGSRVSLADLKDRKAVVVLFLGTECPVNNAYLPRLAELHKEYAARGVQFLGVNANRQDTAERVAEHARKYAVPFPVLKDEGNAVADQFGARRTPEAFVIDAAGQVRYQGRIDDQFAVGVRRAAPTRRDLAEALDALLAGRPVEQPTTPVAGCLISRATRPKAEGEVTFSKQVVRVLQKNCQECHRPGQVGPMALLTYDDALSWAETIREVVKEERMPPWHADPRYGKFSNDRRLAKEDRDALLAWIAQDCPKGDEHDLPPPREFVRGWTVGKPDLVIDMGRDFDVPAEAPKGGIPYKYFSVETGFKEDKWVTRAEARAGAPSAVHHIVVFIQPPGQQFVPGGPGGRVLCGMAPGDMPLILPPGAAKKVPAGSRLVFQMHYTPSGTAVKDRSSVGLIFADKPPERQVVTVPVANLDLRIPPGADNHQVEADFAFRAEAGVLSFMPHMHLRGKDFLVEALYPDGKKEILLSVPRYDFNWQSVYRLAEPKQLPRGTRLHCVAHFDNSAKNPNNPDATEEVHWGDQTWEEMMIGWTDLVYDRKEK